MYEIWWGVLFQEMVLCSLLLSTMSCFGRSGRLGGNERRWSEIMISNSSSWTVYLLLRCRHRELWLAAANLADFYFIGQRGIAWIQEEKGLHDVGQHDLKKMLPDLTLYISSTTWNLLGSWTTFTNETFLMGSTQFVCRWTTTLLRGYNLFSCSNAGFFYVLHNPNTDMKSSNHVLTSMDILLKKAFGYIISIEKVNYRTKRLNFVREDHLFSTNNHNVANTYHILFGLVLHNHISFLQKDYTITYDCFWCTLLAHF